MRRAALALLALLAGVLGGALAGPEARAHLSEVAVLQLNELGNGRYTVVWELEPITPQGDRLEPTFPAHCTYEAPTLDCGTRDLVGELTFANIGSRQSAALFKITSLEGSTRVLTVTPAQPVAKVTPGFDASSWAGMAEIFAAYLNIGIEHILLGIDHLLFVLGLIWIARGRWMLFKTITAFTVAHSVTLGAVTFGWVGVPELFVNALIALSIVFIGVEVLHARAGRSTVTLRHPWAVSFGFGLLHGFGFANALIELGLPQDAVPLALLAFNLGVEVGQIAFVLGVLAMAWAYRVMQVHWPDWSRTVPAYAIGGLAAFWFLDRVSLLLGA